MPDQEGLAFGSHVNGTARKYTDLDLAIPDNVPLPIRISVAFDDSFAELGLPSRVDLVDWACVKENFREFILRCAVKIQTPSNSSVKTETQENR